MSAQAVHTEGTMDVVGLSKSFTLRAAGLLGGGTPFRAVDDVSFTLRPGTVTALVGESGSGKSTVARMLARLHEPTSGAVLFEGTNVVEHTRRRDVRRYRSRVQMIFQDPFDSLNPVRTIGHHLERPLRIHDVVPREDVEARIHDLLRTVGLVPADRYAAKYPHELSGGQRQRVAIARALAVEPSVILADEPISMLDVSIRIGILNLILELKERRRIGFLYITHDIASARYVADELLVMYAGQVVEQGPTDAVLVEPLHPYTKLLLSAVPHPDAAQRGAPVASRDARYRGPFGPGTHLVEVRPGHLVRVHDEAGTAS